MVGRAVLVLNVLNDDVGGVRFTEGVYENSTVQYKTFLERWHEMKRQKNTQTR